MASLSGSYYSDGSTETDTDDSYKFFSDEDCTQGTAPLFPYYVFSFKMRGTDKVICFGGSSEVDFASAMTVNGTDVSIAKGTYNDLTVSISDFTVQIDIEVIKNFTAKMEQDD